MTHFSMLKETLFNLLNINSPSGLESVVVRFVMDYFNQLGLYPSSDALGNCYIFVPGDGDPVLLTAHLDTVSNGIAPIPCEKNGLIRASNNAILGLDDKASVAVLLEVVKNLMYSERKHRPLEIIFTVQEEPGCVGVKHFLEHQSSPLKSRTGLCFDFPKPFGSILQRAAGIWRATIEFNGKASHAARPEMGHNAVAVASQFIISCLKRNQEKNTRINVGSVAGGKHQLFNVVPDRATIEVELRSITNVKTELQIFKNDLKQLSLNTGVHATIVKEYVHIKEYRHAERDLWIVQITRGLEQFGVSPTIEPYSFGASDANLFQAHGINVAVLGNGVENTHTTTERVELTQLTTTYDFLFSFLTMT